VRPAAHILHASGPKSTCRRVSAALTMHLYKVDPICNCKAESHHSGSSKSAMLTTVR
jgi:hypothetical protein